MVTITPLPVPELHPLLLLATVLPFLLLISTLLFRHRRRRLPPGSMGWPHFGETKLLYGGDDPNSFFFSRHKKYGEIFKTHILGCPSVMISNPDAARAILVTQPHLFKPTYPPSKERLIGRWAIFFHQGDYHSKLKRIVHSSLLPSSIRRSVSEVENLALDLLSSWNSSDVCHVNTLDQMKRFAFDVAMMSVFGERLERNEEEEIRRLYATLERGYNSMPLNFPLTKYRSSVKARDTLDKKLKMMMEKRIRQSGGRKGGYGRGLLGAMLSNNRNNKAAAGDDGGFSETQIADNIIGLIFAANDTTASVLTWLLKYLYENPAELRAVTEEQDLIKAEIKEAKRQLTWDDTKRMPLTNRVIQETLRAASVLLFLFREAVKDVEFGGYIIPKGWKVLPVFRTLHHSADFFPHPERFDPSRFEVPPRPNTYLPFGTGLHSCPGSDLARLEMLVFLHHLTTTYKYGTNTLSTA
ncbi:Abscisic acid 8'-hydroxylase 2 [Linum perenne]